MDKLYRHEDKLNEKEEAGDVEEANKLRVEIETTEKKIKRNRPIGVTLCTFLIAIDYAFMIFVALLTLPHYLADTMGLISLFLTLVILFIVGRIIYGLFRMERGWGWLGAEILLGIRISLGIFEIIMGDLTGFLLVAVYGLIFIYLFTVKDTFTKKERMTPEHALKYAIIKNEGVDAFTIAKNTFKKFEDLVEGQKFEAAANMIVGGRTYKPFSSDEKKEWIKYMKNNPDQRLVVEVLSADYIGPEKIFVKFSCFNLGVRYSKSEK